MDHSYLFLKVFYVIFLTSIPGFQLMAEERGLLVDVDGFNKAMEEARERSRSAQNKVLQLIVFTSLKIVCCQTSLRR